MIRQWVREVTQREPTQRGKLRAVRAWIDDRVDFKPDPPGVELLQHPTEMLDQVNERGYAVGDCDCVATLAAAAGMALRAPCRFVVVGFERWGPFAHVYTVCDSPEGPVDFDTTRPAQLPPGVRPKRAAQVTV